MMELSVATGIIFLIVVLAPFFSGRGGTLAAASSETSAPKLRAQKQVILQRYLSEEQAFTDKNISSRTWQRRRTFLMHRYIDAARRLDYLENVATAGETQKQGT